MYTSAGKKGSSLLLAKIMPSLSSLSPFPSQGPLIQVWPPVIHRVGGTAQRWHKLSLLDISLPQSRSLPCKRPFRVHWYKVPHNTPYTLAAHPNTPLSSSLHSGGRNSSCQGAKHRLELITHNPAPQYLRTMNRAGPGATGSFNQESRSSNKLVVTKQVQSGRPGPGQDPDEVGPLPN